MHHKSINVGVKHPKAKLKEEDVIAIRSLASTKLVHAEIADRFDISESNVGLIVNRKTWRHIQ